MLYIAIYVKFADPDHSGGTPAGGIVGIIWYVTRLCPYAARSPGSMGRERMASNLAFSQDLHIRLRMVLWTLGRPLRYGG